MNLPTIVGILLAGGQGQRFGEGENKLLAPLNGQPVIWHSAMALIQGAALSQLLVVSHPDWQMKYQAALNALPFQGVMGWVTGGATRRESAWQALQQLGEDVDWVLIHDAARPFAQPSHIARAIGQLAMAEEDLLGVTLATPMAYTLKNVDPQTQRVRSTLDRQDVWAIQTPQVFRREPLLQAHQQVASDHPATDDASLVEALFPDQAVIGVCEDTSRNLKITTPSDWQLAQALAMLPENEKS